MRESIFDFPNQLKAGYATAGTAGKEYGEKKFKNIVIVGMGGSALPGELLKTVAGELNLKIPVTLHRDYGLPQDGSVGHKTLIIISSHSGTTEETLSAYEEALKQKLTIVAITSGGILKTRTHEMNTPVAIVPKDIQPRLAVGYQFAALLALLHNTGLVPSQKNEMAGLEKSLNSEALEDAGKNLAQKIKDTVPLIYSSKKYGVLSYILKIQMNENAKLHAFANTFPELNHNEMVGFTKQRTVNKEQQKFSILVLRAEDDDARIQKRMALTAEFIENKGYPVHTIDIEGQTIYNRVFNTILLGNWLSYYLAINKNIDPTPVDIVEDFKKKLAS